MDASPLAVVQELYAAFSRRDLPALLARLHPEISWAANVDLAAPGAKAVPCYQPGHRRAFVADYFTKLAAGYDMLGFMPRAFLAGGREVAVRIEIDFVVRPTGRRVRGEVLHHWIVDDAGLITRFLDFEDTLAFTAAWTRG